VKSVWKNPTKLNVTDVATSSVSTLGRAATSSADDKGTSTVLANTTRARAGAHFYYEYRTTKPSINININMVKLSKELFKRLNIHTRQTKREATQKQEEARALASDHRITAQDALPARSLARFS
jgi:hypothetical protein